MATTPTETPTPTAPDSLAVSWIAVSDRVGTARVTWLNRSGAAYPSYQRVDLRVRPKLAPANVFVLRTWSPYTGVNSATVTAMGNWSAVTYAEWEFEVVASISGKTASTGWKSLAPLVTPKPDITSVQRTSEADAWVYFTAPTSGIEAPTAASVALSTTASDAGRSTQKNNVALPATRVRLPIPAGTGSYRAWLSYYGPAGWSAQDVANVPAWWTKPDAVTNLSGVRLSSNRATVSLSWTASGAGGAKATSYRVERSADGQAWSFVATTASTSYQTTLALGASMRYRVTPINPAGSGSPQTVTVDSWWTAVPGATDLVSSRTASGQIQLGWGVPSTTATNQVRSIIVRRRPVTGGDYVTVATLSASTRTWVDASTSITSQWQYEIIVVGDLGWASSRPSITVKTGMSAPDGPSQVTAVRDASNPDLIHVSFTPRSTGDAPTVEVRLMSRDLSGKVTAASDWVKLSSLPAFQLSHAAGPNRILSYAVEARNAAGVSTALTWTDPISTTPLGASTLSATRVGTDVHLGWKVDGDTIATSWEIERSADGGATRFPIPSPTVGTARTATHADASFDVEHAYWVRAVRDGVASEWVKSTAAVPAGAEPLAPLITEPGWGAVGEPVTVEWEHRPSDGTPQSEAEVGWLLGTTQQASVMVSGDTSTVTLPWTAEAGWTVAWAVRTRGTGSTLWSPWSMHGLRKFAERPTLALTVPDVVAAQKLTGSITPPSAWVSATVELLDASGNVVSTQLLTPSTGTAFSFDVEDRKTYTVRATLTDGRLRSAPQTAQASVEWLRPTPPALTATVVGERVRLETETGAGLRLVRENFSPAENLTDWSWSGADLTTATVDGDQVGAMTATAGQAAPQITKSLDAATMKLWVDWMPLDERAVLQAFLASDPATVVTVATATAEIVGTWQRIEVAVPTSATGPDALHLQLAAPADGATAAYLRRPLLTTQAESDTAWFDGASQRDGYIYGWLLSGSAFEAVQAATVDEADPRLPTAARVEIIRVTDGASQSLGDVEQGVAWDRWPRFCQPETYVARAWSADGAWSDSAPVQVIVHQRDIVVNFGPGLSGRVTAGPRSQLPVTGGTVERAVIQWVGRDTPSVYAGRTRSPRTVSVSAMLWEHHSTLAEWVAAHNAVGTDPLRPLPALLRDPSGVVVLGVLQVDARNHEHRFRREVNFTFTETGPRP